MGIVINSGTILRGSTVRSSYPGDNYLPYTTLLLNGNGANNANNNVFVDASTNNFAITRNGNATQGTFSPFSKSGWSNYFDGSGDSLTLTGVNLSSGNWTIECFVYFQSFATTTTSHIFSIGTDGNNRFALYRISTTSKFNFITVNSGVYVSAESTTVPTVGQWYHVAVVSNSGTRTLYVNGVAEVTSTSAINNGTSYSIGNLQYTPGVSDPLTGYISNFRVVTSAVYTGNFTPPTAPLTAISGTSLLTCQSNRFIDTNTQAAAKTITVNGDTSVVAFSPFASTDDWNPSVHGGSGYFDGNLDYLTWTGTSVGSGAFTFECWFYYTGTFAGTASFIGPGNATTNALSIAISNSTTIQVDQYGVTATSFTVPTMTANQWYHLAVVRNSGGSCTVFLNGTRSSTGAVSITTNFANVAAIGYVSSAVPRHWIGYLAGVTYNSTALYDPTSSNITIPTSPTTAVPGTQLLLNFTNAGIYDATSKNDLETVGNAQISTSVSKFGGGSIAFDGTGDYLVSRYPTADMTTFGTGDFTIEMWIRFTNASTTPEMIFLDFRPGAGNQIAPMFYVLSNTVRYYVNGFDRITSATISSGQWYHLAVARSGTSTKMFIDGTQSGSTYTDSNNYISGASYPVIGAARDGLYGVDGYIDDLRITKGYARYTANFTPPERQLLGKA